MLLISILTIGVSIFSNVSSLRFIASMAHIGSLLIGPRVQAKCLEGDFSVSYVHRSFLWA